MTTDDKIKAIQLKSRLLLFVLTLFGLLATMVPFSGAVIAPGQWDVSGRAKKVQHKTGGDVAELLVREGSRVQERDILIRLDDTQVQASLGVIASEMAHLTGRRARFLAARDGGTIAFPKDFEAQHGDIAAGERRALFELRSRAQSEIARHLAQVKQLEEQIRGHTIRRSALSQEHVYVTKELTVARRMMDEGLTNIARLYDLEARDKRLAGEQEHLESQSKVARDQIIEKQHQIKVLVATIRSDAQSELRTLEARLAELTQRHRAEEDNLMRLDIGAPRDGIVHEMAVHTVGGVVQAGEVLMLIVPHKDPLVVNVRVGLADVDQVKPGQDVRLRMSAFNQNTTPELIGRVDLVAADQSLDPQTGAGHYGVRIAIDQMQRDRLGTLKLRAGMPVEALIQTDTRTFYSYVAKALGDHASRAFREGEAQF